MAQYFEKKSISTALAKALVERADGKAKELGIAVDIAVVDEAGDLKEFRHMDGASILSIEIAQNKAYTTIAFGLPSGEWYPIIKDQPALLHGLPHASRLIIFGGGFPIRLDGQVVGGIGVSGGTVEQDEICAQAALGLLEAG